MFNYQAVFIGILIMIFLGYNIPHDTETHPWYVLLLYNTLCIPNIHTYPISYLQHKHYIGTMQYTNHIPIINSWYTNFIASGKLTYKQLLKITLYSWFTYPLLKKISILMLVYQKITSYYFIIFYHYHFQTDRLTGNSPQSSPSRNSEGKRWATSPQPAEFRSRVCLKMWYLTPNCHS